MKSFFGGVRVPHNKFTEKNSITVSSAPEKVYLPLNQNIGAPCKPLVKKGAKVRKGQKIADTKSFVSAPLHSPVSGEVESIGSLDHPVTGTSETLIISSDGKDTETKSGLRSKNVSKLSKKELRDIIREAGIVGLGGAAFPAHVKLTPPEGKNIDTLIINGAECEPYLTCDHRVMLENTSKIIKGIRLLMKILEPDKCYIAIEDNKKDAVDLFRKYTEGADIDVLSLSSVYPQGAEKNIVYSVTGRKVPNEGGLPLDVGCVVQNVQTVKAVYDAVYENKPLIERVMTVTGAVREPKNMLVRIGTPVNELIEHAGGYKGRPKKVIFGGPMMGTALLDDTAHVIKGTSGIVIQNELPGGEERDCIRCGRCIEACPMNLMPTMIHQYARKGYTDKTDEYHVRDCVECGACAYECPSKIPLVQWAKYAKEEICRNGKK